MSRMHLALCAAGALLMLTGFGWANSVGDTPWQRPLQVFSFDFGDQAQAGDLAFGASGPADLSATTEEDEDGIYDRFADQIGDILAVEPASDRFSWAILLIAFAGMTAAASGRRRPRRTTISI